MAGDRAGDDVVASLIELSDALARQFADRRTDGPRLERLDGLRNALIAAFRPGSAPASFAWLTQAHALNEWQHEVRLHCESQTASARSLQAFSSECRRLQEQLRDARSNALFGKKPSTDVMLLISNVESFLTRCRQKFTELSMTSPDRSGEIASLESRLASAVDQLPTSSPVSRLMTFRQLIVDRDIERCAEVLPRSITLVQQCHATWQTELVQARPTWSGEAIECVILLRALLEELSNAQAGTEVLSELAVLARELLKPFGIRGELIRDVKQPPDWFDSPIEADVPEPAVERIGWALRQPPGDWLGFPRGRLIVPLPVAISPTAEAVETLSRLVRECTWLSPLGSSVSELAKANPSILAESTPVIARLLKALVGLCDSPVDPTSRDSALQSALAMTRQWAVVAGLQILPRAWRFDRHPSMEQLAADEVERVYAFDPVAGRGDVIEVRRFGLADSERVIHDGSVVIAAGPAPDGFAELQNLAHEAADTFDARVLGRLDGWAEAALKGSLDVVAVQFYVDFHGELGESWRLHQPELARAFEGRLAYFLQYALGLFCFSPTAYQDYPDGWLQRTGGRGMVTGRVRRILRPGLQDHQNQLRLPALVEVE